MELQRGLPLLFQQYTALLRKNGLLSWRSKAATFLQLCASFFFIFLLFCIEEATKASNASGSSGEVLDPVANVNLPIPPCEDKFFIKTPCYDFVWSGSDNKMANSIVEAIMANNPGRSISSNTVKSFKTPSEVDDWLSKNPMYCPGALHFKEINGSQISYGLQTNSTQTLYRGRSEDPTFKFQIPLQIAAEREIARLLLGDPKFSWDVGIKEFSHPAEASANMLSSLGPPFFLAFAMFGFVMQLGSLVTEKELKLRQAMNMTGLYDTAYWISWITWEGLLTFFSSLFVVIFGMMFQFDFFKKNSFLVVFLLFFLFQLSMLGFAFMLSTFISKSSGATTAGFSIFIVGFMTQLVTVSDIPYGLKDKLTLKKLWSLFPPNVLAACVKMLGDATDNKQDKGISWTSRKDCASADKKCFLTLNDGYLWFVGNFVLWFTLAIYFDNILPNVSGVRKPILYFLMPSYWTGTGGSKVQEGGICTCLGSVPTPEYIAPDDEDVLEEENIVKQDVKEGRLDPNVAVQIRGLIKTFAGTVKISCSCCCCRCKKAPPYHAVRGLWVNFAKDQLFCMLGPNGAGKTTTISCLTGLTPVTSGDALIYGSSVRSSVGMSNIRRFIGVCPQFDILWDTLTGREHLQLFASMKGLPADSIDRVADELLDRTKLTASANARSRSYSGGMKRRLSVAIALIGDPKLVILDEPTTGMDPITRRHVWDIIQEAKKGRAIVLTTHSMEEADILSDRIGIMAKGRLRCVGTSIRLKSKFGTGFVTNVSFVAVNDTNSQKLVQNLFKQRLNTIATEETSSYLTFVIPHDKEKLLTKFFAELENRKGEFGIADIQLGLATLEEVFLNIARKAELETAAAEGRMATLNLKSGTQLLIPVGARYVGIPGTESMQQPSGLMVEVYWEQDDSGVLCISGHSDETPVPSSVQLTLLPPPGTTLGNKGPVYGIVIDPNQISNEHERED